MEEPQGSRNRKSSYSLTPPKIGPEPEFLTVKLLGCDVNYPLPRVRELVACCVRSEGKKSRAELRGSPELWPKAADRGSTPPRTNGHRHPLECRSEYTQFHAVGASTSPVHEGLSQCASVTKSMPLGARRHAGKDRADHARGGGRERGALQSQGPVAREEARLAGRAMVVGAVQFDRTERGEEGLGTAAGVAGRMAASAGQAGGLPRGAVGGWAGFGRHSRQVRGRRGPCQSEPSALSRSWTASAASCGAQRRAAVSRASKSSAASGPRLSSASISAWMAAATALPRVFFARGSLVFGQAGIAQLLADLDQFAGQAAQALAFLDLSARLGDAFGRNRAGGLATAGLAVEHEVGPVAGILLVLAAAGGLAAAHELLAQRSGAQVADGGELAADAVALLLEGGCVMGVWHGAYCLYYASRKDNVGRNPCNECGIPTAFG